MRTAKKQRLVKVVGFRLMAVTGLTLTLIWLVTCATWYRRDENEDKSIGKLVGHRQKLLCFILSNPDRVASSVSVKETWGSRCDGLLFFRLVRLGFLYCYQNYQGDIRWPVFLLLGNGVLCKLRESCHELANTRTHRSSSLLFSIFYYRHRDTLFRLVSFIAPPFSRY